MELQVSALDGVLLSLVLIEGIAAAIAARHWRNYSRERRGQGAGRPWRVPRTPVQEFDPLFRLDARLGHLPSTEVVFISSHNSWGATSDYEAWVLAVLAKRATTMFEFGTYAGRTTYLWARNSPAEARIYTITLDESHAYQYRESSEDRDRDIADAIAELSPDRFLYTGTDVEYKVKQLYGDSMAFDETPLIGACDLIFIDGSHARSYVLSDSQKALRMIKPGGSILWHDYRGPHRSTGVYETLNRLSEQLPLTHIEGTSLVAYRAPAPQASASIRPGDLTYPALTALAACGR